ncbi:MAG: PaaI family thioesterase [Rubrimonas sp.]
MASNLLTEMMEGLPHARAIGLRAVSAANGVAVMAVDWRADLVGDPDTGVIHGGVVTALLDTCCGMAVLAAPGSAAATATLDLRIDYMRAARPGATVTARAECIRSSRSVAFVRATAWDADPADPVAQAAGAFMLTAAAEEGGA